MPRLQAQPVIVDEIGLASAVLGDVRLRTSYHALFARDGENLCPVAVEGLVVPWRGGRPLDLASLVSLGPDFARRAYWLGRSLSIANMDNIGAEAPLGLLMRLEGDDEAAFVAETLLAEAEKAGLDPRLLIVLAEGTGAVATALQPWRDAGASVAVSDLAAADPAGRHGAVDLIRIPAPWISQRLADNGPSRLLHLAAGRLREAGIGLLVDGIDTEAHLHAALAVSADLMQGAHLAAPFRVGTIFDEAPRPIAPPQKVVRLFG